MASGRLAWLVTQWGLGVGRISVNQLGLHSQRSPGTDQIYLATNPTNLGFRHCKRTKSHGTSRQHDQPTVLVDPREIQPLWAVWHGFADSISEGSRYNLYGPMGTISRYRFNPQKTAVDRTYPLHRAIFVAISRKPPSKSDHFYQGNGQGNGLIDSRLMLVLLKEYWCSITWAKSLRALLFLHFCLWLFTNSFFEPWSCEPFSVVNTLVYLVQSWLVTFLELQGRKSKRESASLKLVLSFPSWN